MAFSDGKKLILHDDNVRLNITFIFFLTLYLTSSACFLLQNFSFRHNPRHLTYFFTINTCLPCKIY